MLIFEHYYLLLRYVSVCRREFDPSATYTTTALQYIKMHMYIERCLWRDNDNYKLRLATMLLRTLILVYIVAIVQ